MYKVKYWPWLIKVTVNSYIYYIRYAIKYKISNGIFSKLPQDGSEIN